MSRCRICMSTVRQAAILAYVIPAASQLIFTLQFSYPKKKKRRNPFSIFAVPDKVGGNAEGHEGVERVGSTPFPCLVHLPLPMPLLTLWATE